MVTTTTQSDEQIQKDVLAEWLFGNYCGIRILAKLNYSIINKLYYTVRHFCAVFTVIPKEPAELKWDARVLSNEIGVAVKDGVVTLTGWVDSYTKRWAAENAAYRVHGVKAVVNDIEVRLPSSAKRTDADIAAVAIRAWEWDAFVSVDKLEVTVSKGWVTLKGEVKWQYQKQDAERAVRRLMCVKGVSNLITVKPRVIPSELKAKIEQALVRTAETDAQRITVEVEGSKAILKGTARSGAEREEAKRTA